MDEKIVMKEPIKDKNVGRINLMPKYVVENLINKIDFEKANVIVKYGLGNEETDIILRRLIT